MLILQYMGILFWDRRKEWKLTRPQTPRFPCTCIAPVLGQLLPNLPYQLLLVRAEEQQNS